MSVIPLDEAKSHLNIPASDTRNDTELQRFLNQAESAVARRTGPLVATPVTRRVSGGPGLALPVTPVLSLTSVTPTGGTALNTSTLRAGDGGVIGYSSGSGSFGSAAYDVVYVAGWAADAASLPDDLKLGILELFRHLWDTQRRGRGNSEQAPAGPGFAFPYRVEELLAPFMLPGFA